MLLTVADLHTEAVSSSGTTRILEGVSLNLDRGKTLGVVGETGAGKSMLGRSILRLLPRGVTTTGRVCLDGEEITEASIRSRAAVIFQDPMTALSPVVRIERQITEAMAKGLSRASKKELACELLNQVGIADAPRRLRQYPHELSGGMRQRICIAIALARRPELLVADEPTTALDVTIQRQILELLTKLQTELEMGIMIVTHDFGVVASLTDEVIVMFAGRIVERGRTATIFAKPQHPYTATLLAAMPRLDQLAPTTGTEVALGRSGPAATVGCRYALRCHRATEICGREDPALREVDTPGHEVTCFHPLGLSQHAPTRNGASDGAASAPQVV